mmetsp:Transcript_61916/g.164638  ORF Transcript_61916/g.164638 Transcript_61916/m.164638 type:complete len:380 (-) Transcript_61916:625-1764(-)
MCSSTWNFTVAASCPSSNFTSSSTWATSRRVVDGVAGLASAPAHVSTARQLTGPSVPPTRPTRRLNVSCLLPAWLSRAAAPSECRPSSTSRATNTSGTGGSKERRPGLSSLRTLMMHVLPGALSSSLAMSPSHVGSSRCTSKNSVSCHSWSSITATSISWESGPSGLNLSTPSLRTYRGSLTSAASALAVPSLVLQGTDTSPCGLLLATTVSLTLPSHSSTWTSLLANLRTTASSMLGKLAVCKKPFLPVAVELLAVPIALLARLLSADPDNVADSVADPAPFSVARAIFRRSAWVGVGLASSWRPRSISSSVSAWSVASGTRLPARLGTFRARSSASSRPPDIVGDRASLGLSDGITAAEPPSLRLRRPPGLPMTSAA